MYTYRRFVYTRGRTEARQRCGAIDQLRKCSSASMNIDIVTAVALHLLGLRAKAGEVLFQIARTVGMSAHLIEEYSEQPLRWRANNTE